MLVCVDVIVMSSAYNITFFECRLLYYSVLRLSTACSRSVYQQDFSDYFAFDRFFMFTDFSIMK